MLTEKPAIKIPSRQGKAKEQFWRKVLTRFRGSGLTQVEFCRREGLNPGNLSWWKRQIGTRDEKSRPGSRDGGKSNSRQTKQAYWRDIIVRFNNSGLSKDDFCAHENIKPQAFVWWRGELSRRDNEKRQAVAHSLESELGAFVPLGVMQSPVATRKSGERQAVAEIDIFTGVVNVFDTATTEAWAALLRAAREVGG